MPISKKHKIIFIHIPKNAGTTITNELNMSDFGHHYPEYYIKKYPKEWIEYKKIAVIRNPWDRVVSNYEYSKMEKSYWHSSTEYAKFGKHPDYDVLKDKSFKECISLLKQKKLKHQGWSTQSSYLKNNNVLLSDIILLPIESLCESLQSYTNIKISKKINSSNHSNFKDYYNDELISTVGKIYQEDIKNFNYQY